MEHYEDALPEGVEHTDTSKPYWRLSQMKDGENKIRVVMRPICGWVEWVNKKPIRTKASSIPPKATDPKLPPKPFWALYVWDYARESLFILDITQRGIQKDLIVLAKDPEWGALTNYDLKINKEGTGMESKYRLNPVPPKPMSKKIEQALKDFPVRLEALFEGGDPWVDLVDKNTGEVKYEA